VEKKFLKKLLKKRIKMCHKVTKKLSKSCQKKSKKLSQKLSKSCQQIVKKLSKSCQNVVPPTNYFGPTSAKPSDKHSKPKLENSENLKEWYEESRIDKEWYRLMMNLGIHRPYATSSHLVKINFYLQKTAKLDLKYETILI
jgi:hypothetical protein